MSMQYTINQAPSTGAAAMYLLKEALKSAGWIIQASGDGLSAFSITPGNVNDQITNNGSGANGMANDLAWFAIKAPTGSNQFCIQRATGSNTQWWVRYSFSAGFTGTGNGARSSTISPTATDQKNITGVDNTGVAVFPADGTYKQHIQCDNASPYGFLSVTIPNGGGNVSSMQFWDPVTSDTSDADAYVYLWSTGTITSSVLPVAATIFTPNSAWSRLDLTFTNGLVSGYLKKGRSGEGFVGLSCQFYVGGNSGALDTGPTLPCGCGTDQNNDYDDLMPLLWGRGNAFSGNALASPVGYKGVSTLFKWMSTNRSTGTLVSVSSTGDRMILNGCVAIQWNGSTVTL